MRDIHSSVEANCKINLHEKIISSILEIATSHIYDEATSIEICENIKSKYVQEFNRLLIGINERIGNV